MAPTGNRRFCPSSMRGNLGCFVCGKCHLERKRHAPSEFTAAVRDWKAKVPSAPVTVDVLSDALDNFQEDEREKEPSEGDDEIGWAEDHEDELHFVCLMQTALKREEERDRNRENMAFLHGSTFDKAKRGLIFQEKGDLRTCADFRVVKLDTGAICRRLYQRDGLRSTVPSSRSTL